MNRLNDVVPTADRVPLGHYDLNAQLLAIELIERGYEPKWLRRNLFVIEVNGTRYGFSGAQTPTTSSVAVRIAKQKALAAEMLRESGVAVAEGRVFEADNLELAAKYAENLASPVVVKPNDGRKGLAVTVGVKPGPEFDSAFRLATEHSNEVLVERQFTNAVEARFLVVGDTCVAVSGRKPPTVVGNGRDTVQQLIDTKNRKRRKNPDTRNLPIKLDDNRIGQLAIQGYTVDDIPADGAIVVIDRKAGISTGGDSVDLTDDVHPSYLRVATTAASAIAGLDPAGVDILARDFAATATPTNHIVCEMNSGPGFSTHHFPVEGRPRNVAKAIVDHTLRVIGC